MDMGKMLKLNVSCTISTLDMKDWEKPTKWECANIGGISPADLLQRRDDVTYDLNQTNLEWVFEGTRFTELQALINGTSGSFTPSLPSADVNNNRYDFKMFHL